jgi:hypothetical protein
MRSSLLFLAALSACGSVGGTMYGAHSPTRTATADPAVGRPYYGGDSAPAADNVAISTGGGRVDPAPTERPGLGTRWGEDVYAPVTMKPFERASDDPWATAVIRYNDDLGVAAQARYYGGQLAPLEIYPGDGSIGVALVSESGALLPGFSSGGQTLVVGHDGDRYRIVVRNSTDARFEIVASVDGLDVLDGKPAGVERRGYILEPRGELVIDGFRQTDERVAAFRFGAVASSYAAQTSGDSNVGVVGVAIFPEKGATWTPGELARRGAADPFPARTYATPP